MRTLLFALIFLASIALQAQTTSLTPPVMRKNNLKITAVEMGEGFLHTPVTVTAGGYRSFSFQYERLLKNRHTFTFSPSFSVSKYNFSNGYFSSRGFTLGVGYRYYLYQWTKSKPFNGLYGGVGISSGEGALREYNNGKRTSNTQYNWLGSSVQLGVQTTLFKRFSLEVEGSYGINRYHYSHFNSTQHGLIMSLRLGYTF